MGTTIDSSDPDNTPTKMPATRNAATSANAMPDRNALPDCGRIAATLGDVVAGWSLMDKSGPWDNPGRQGYRVDCMWASPQMRSENAFEKVQGVVVGKVGVSLVQTGIMLVNATEEGRHMTHRRAVDAAVAVHRLIER